MSLKPLNSPGGFSVGEITSGAINVISSLGNVSTGNIIGTDNGNLNIIANNLLLDSGNLTAGNILALGNVEANYFLGNIRSATGGYSNANVLAYLGSNAALDIVTAGNITASGNITGGNIVSTNAVIGNIDVGNIQVSGNITVDSLTSNTTVTATGNVSGGNLTTAGQITATGNITGGNLITTGNAVVGGIKTDTYMYANGQPLDMQQPAGLNTQIQYNNNGDFGASATLTFNQATNLFYLGGNANIANSVTIGGNLTTIGSANLGPTQVNGNLVVAGNISATGNITYINVQDLVIDDPLIYLGANNPGDTEDLGIVASYNDGNYAHTGFARDYTDDTWKVFSGVTSEPNTVIAWSEAVYASFKAGPILSNASITANANITAVGNIQGGNIISTNAVIGNIDVGNIAVTGNVTVNSLTSNTTVTATGNITGGNLNTAGIVSATGGLTTVGNISGNYVIANGYHLTSINGANIVGGYSNANVANYLPTYTGNLDSLTGNVITTANATAAYFIGNGYFLTAVNGANIIGGYSNANVANYLPTYTGNVGAGNLNIVGNIVDTGALSIITAASGNISLAPNGTNSFIATTAGANVIGNLDVTGNLTAGNFIGTGTNTIIASGVYSWTFDSLGNLNLPASGNLVGGNLVTSNYYSGNGYFLSSINGANVLGGYGNSQVAAYLSSNATQNIAVNGNIVATGNITGGNIISTNAVIGNIDVGNIAVTGNVTVNSLTSNTTVTATGNITGGNVSGGNTVTANFFIGNGYLLTSINGANVVGGYGNAQVAAYLQVYNGNALFNNVTVSQDAVIQGNLTVQGNTTYINVSDLVIEDKNIIVAANATATPADLNDAGLQIGNMTAGGNITFFYNSTSNLMVLSHGANIANVLNVSGAITGTGNVSGANLTTAGNVSGNLLLGNGYFITGIQYGNINGTYGNANVANYLASGANNYILLGNSNSSITTGGTVRTYGDAIANNFIANNTLTIQSTSTQAVVFDAINQTTNSNALATLANINVSALPTDTQALEVTLRGKDGNNGQAGKIMIVWSGIDMDYTRYAEVIVQAGCGVPSVSFDGSYLLIQVTPLNSNSMTWNGSIMSV